MSSNFVVTLSLNATQTSNSKLGGDEPAFLDIFLLMETEAELVETSRQSQFYFSRSFIKLKQAKHSDRQFFSSRIGTVAFDAQYSACKLLMSGEGKQNKEKENLQS